MQTTRKSNIETKQLQDVLNDSQSTHNSVVSNSVGLALVKLSYHYFGNSIAAEEKADQAYKNCITELNKIALEKKDYAPGINYIIQQAEEKPHPDLDRVTLYVNEKDSTQPSSKKKESIYIPLKRVLTLVWISLHDKAKFEHKNNQKPDRLADEKATATKAITVFCENQFESKINSEHDHKARLETFFNTLNQLQARPVCHVGTRNELVLVLNGIYQGIHIIEHGNTATISFLKEKIHTKFWSVYDDSKTSSEIKNKLN